MVKDPNFVKAYYRKADACIALSQHDNAMKCLKKLIQEFKVTDPDAKEKYNFVRKIIREKAFSEAISADEKYADEVDIDKIEVETGYTGPRVE